MTIDDKLKRAAYRAVADEFETPYHGKGSGYDSQSACVRLVEDFPTKLEDEDVLEVVAHAEAGWNAIATDFEAAKATDPALTGLERDKTGPALERFIDRMVIEHGDVPRSFVETCVNAQWRGDGCYL